MNFKIPKVVFISFFIGFFLLIIVIFIILNLFSQQPTDEKNPVIPTPIPSSIPKPTNTSQISEVSVSPPENIADGQIKNPSQSIIFTLSENISPPSIRATSSPFIPLKIVPGQSANEIIISPDPPEFWKPDTLYLITLYDQNNQVITSYSISVPQYVPQGEPL